MPRDFEKAFRAYAKGDTGRARALVEGYLRERPGAPKGVFLLGLLDLEEGAMESGARRLADAGNDFEPPYALAHRAGRLFFDHKDYKRAEHWLERATALDPAKEASHYWLGNAYRIQRRAEEAEKHLKKALELAPGRARAYVALAYLYREHGRQEEAAQTMMALNGRGPKDPETRTKIAGFLTEIGRYEQAEEVLTRLLPEKKQDTGFLLELGRIRQRLGMAHEAGQAFRRAIINDPSAAAGYLGLSEIRRFESPGEPDAQILRQGLDNPDIPAKARMCCHFALGKVHDDCGEYRKAFAHFKKANALKAEQHPFDTPAFLKTAGLIRKTFSASYFGEHKAPGPKGPTPVFVIGMPRAGLGLAGRLLDAHPGIYCAGGLNLIPALARGLGGEPAELGEYPENITPLSEETLKAAAGFYLKSLSGMAADQAFLADRNPMNFLHLGLIAALFPEARIVHVRRHPLDTSVSLYFKHFDHDDYGFSYELKAIAGVYKAYRDLMEHWYQVLPLDIFDLDYESLVKFPERVSRRLIDWLGAGWQDEVLDFFEPEARGEGAMAGPGGKVLYRTSIERWKNYAPELEDLKKTFVAANLI